MRGGHTHTHTHGHGHGGSHGPRWLGTVTAIVLGVAAILAGVTTWRAQVMQGHAVEHFTLSTQAGNDANTLAQDAEGAISGERQLFIDYRTALDDGHSARAAQVLAMMTVTSRAAIDWWKGQPDADRPFSPFVSANPAWRAPGVIIDAKAAFEKSNHYVEQAERELARAHNLEFAAAFLTISFLAGGLTGLFESSKLRIGSLAVAGAVLLGSALGVAVFW